MSPEKFRVFRGTGPWCERKRETLENAGHVSPRIWEMTKYNKEGGAAISYHYSWLASPSLLVMFSARHVTSVFQGLSLPLSLSLAPGVGKERTPGTRLRAETDDMSVREASVWRLKCYLLLCLQVTYDRDGGRTTVTKTVITSGDDGSERGKICQQV